MSETPNSNLLDYLGQVSDPRSERNQEHPFISILTIAICGVICGADNWVEIEAYGNAKQDWLESILALPNGIPSHDTFGRVFRMNDDEEFQQSFMSWVRAVSQITQGELVAIDGKQLRGSKEVGPGKEAVCLVSAWACENRLVLGQRQVNEKSNEITAIPELLDMLALHGCVVTIDAIGCQTEIAAKIIEQEADYVLAVKANQGRLHEDINDLFAGFEEFEFADVAYDYYKATNKGHGRLEIRHCWVVSQPDYLAYLRGHQAWKGLNSLIKVISERRINGRSTRKTRYFISSLDDTAAHLLDYCREHWHIENKLHWVLDMAFREDANTVRRDNAPQNLAVLRHMALNLLKHEKTARVGLKAKRLKAGWDIDYLLKVLAI
jgi:predicted transposase YbfD/YdcC